MNYESDTIANVLPRLNTEWFLPALQREFVWDTSRICQFFDSLMRAYPISSLLLWNVPDDSREDLEVYRFLDSASDLDRHNERNRAFRTDELTFVLDGQQRLTSLLIGLGGTYNVRKHYARNVETQRLYLDLLRDGDAPDDQGETAYGLEFRRNSDSIDRHFFWFEVAGIRKYAASVEEVIKEKVGYLKAYGSTPRQLETAAFNLRRLHTAVFAEKSICYHTETHGDQGRMLEIFVRANAGGKPLNKANLLLSNLTVHWETMSARHEIRVLVDKLNESLDRGIERTKAALSQDFVLKSCLMLLDGVSVAYRITSFNRSTCGQIEQNWNEIQKALLNTIEAANWFGISSDNLTSVNALIPIAYFLYRNPSVRLNSDSVENARNASLIRKWLIAALLNGVFSGSSDSMLARIRTVIQKHGENGRPFPVDYIDESVDEAKGIATSDISTVNRILDLDYRDPRRKIALTLLYDERAWGTMKYDCDHIFPKDDFKKELKEYLGLCDRIGNLAILGEHDNREKKAKPFAEWVRTREPAFLTRHLIPADPELWKIEAFPMFFREREKLILERLEKVLGTGRTFSRDLLHVG